MTSSSIINKAESALDPEMAIIVYRNNQNTSSYYLESRRIRKGKMLEGVPLTEKCLSNIVNAISESKADIPHGRLPGNMLFADSRLGVEKYVWYRAPEKRRFYFTKGLNIPEGEILIPGIIYVVSSGVLSVYAFIGNKPKRKLYKAPFFNIYEGGNVCLGSAKVAKPKNMSYQGVIDYWEKMFWQSEFANLLGGNPIKGNLATITKQCIETGVKFPLSELTPIKKTLEDLL
ncbi:PRTRC system protein B [Bacteroides sp. 51]|uniref:PRTRC system protein B n=1 Tax=Bacteroides sp. 51 TaxID=2302938 RepID=UPI0013D3AC07|nr:PRTRC system protein B [Bacteroides sp. 51]